MLSLTNVSSWTFDGDPKPSRLAANLVERLKCSLEAVRSLAKRLPLPPTRSNNGKTLVTVDLSEIAHPPTPAGHRMVTTRSLARLPHSKRASNRCKRSWPNSK